MERSRQVWVGAALTSAALHAALLQTLPAHTPRRAPPLALVRLEVEPPPVPDVAPPPSPPVAPPPAPAPRRARAPRRSPAAPPSGPRGEWTEAGGSAAPGGPAAGGAVADGTGPAAAPGRGGFDPGAVDLTLRPARPAAPPVADSLRPAEGPAPEDRDVKLYPRGGGTMSHDDGEWVAKVDDHGRIEFEDRYVDTPTIIVDEDGRPRIVVPLDFNDVLLSILGDDPYGSQKQKLADATRPLRQRLADEACREDLKQALLEIRGQLVHIQRSRLGQAEKRRLYFKLWDECAEEGPPEVQRTAELIRATILDFIQAELPVRSAEAYSPEELAALNERRRSRQRFEPYGP